MGRNSNSNGVENEQVINHINNNNNQINKIYRNNINSSNNNANSNNKYSSSSNNNIIEGILNSNIFIASDLILSPNSRFRPRNKEKNKNNKDKLPKTKFIKSLNKEQDSCIICLQEFKKIKIFISYHVLIFFIYFA